MKDLPKFKAGDRVWYLPTREWYDLENNGDNIEYPIRIVLSYRSFHTLTIDGKNLTTDLNPLIFHTEQTLNFEKPKFIPKEGELCYFWDDDAIEVAFIAKFKKYHKDTIRPYEIKEGYLYPNCCPITEIPPHLL